MPAPPSHRRLAVAGAISIAAHSAVALAQSEGRSDQTMPTPAPANPTADTDTGPRPSAGADAALLSGPAVAARDAAPTLVRRSFGGELDRLALDPAEAALDLLALDDDARQRALSILDRRAAAMDRVVLDNLDLLTQVETAAQSGRIFRVLQIASTLHTQFAAEVGDEALVDQLAEVLPSEDAQTLRDLVNGYWGALVAEEGGERFGRIEAFVIRRRAALEVFGKEVERAFERVTADDENDDEAWERIIAALDLTPELESEVRAMGERFYIEARLNPTKQELADFLTGVYLKLDPERRTKFFQVLIMSE